MALIIGDEDVETSVCLRGVGVLVFFLLEKGDSYLLFLLKAAWYGSFQW